MPYELTEGGTYMVEVAITNQSVTRHGMPVDVIFDITIAAIINGEILVSPPPLEEYFGAGETKTFEYTMEVPIGSGGQIGDVAVAISDPEGGLAASASEELTVTTEIGDFVYSSPQAYPIPDPSVYPSLWEVPYYSCNIMNLGNVRGTRSITFVIRYYDYDETMWGEEFRESFMVTLEPGQSSIWEFNPLYDPYTLKYILHHNRRYYFHLEDDVGLQSGSQDFFIY